MRITREDLDRMAQAINVALDCPQTTYTKKNGKLVANVGNHFIRGAYGGWKLEKIDNEGGAVEDVLSCGYVPKRQLYEQMQAYLHGIYEGKRVEKCRRYQSMK